MSLPPVSDADLRALDEALVRAFVTGHESALDVLGYGEISCVLRASSGGHPFAAKRLPPMPTEEHLRAYTEAFGRYLDALGARGVAPVASELRVVRRDGEPPVVWCLQPMLPAGSLLPDRLREAAPGDAAALFARVLDSVLEVVGPRLGLDAQLSNWALVDSRLVYFDVTTPLMRDEHGGELLDTELFLASIPPGLRWVVRRFMLRGILDKYYDRRGVVLDLLGNLHKERLAELVPPFVEVANARVAPPLDAGEVRRYYADDARTWALVQRLRRLDRAAHRATGRVYPFLLPGPITR